MTRRISRRAALAALAWTPLALAAAAHAQDDSARNFPVKPIRIVVGYTAGGGNDIIARLVAARMTEGLGQQVVIENRPGAGSIIAAELVAKSPADGYTLVMSPTGPFTINPAI